MGLKIGKNALFSQVFSFVFPKQFVDSLLFSLLWDVKNIFFIATSGDTIVLFLSTLTPLGFVLFPRLRWELKKNNVKYSLFFELYPRSGEEPKEHKGWRGVRVLNNSTMVPPEFSSSKENICDIPK